MQGYLFVTVAGDKTLRRAVRRSPLVPEGEKTVGEGDAETPFPRQVGPRSQRVAGSFPGHVVVVVGPSAQWYTMAGAYRGARSATRNSTTAERPVNCARTRPAQQGTAGGRAACRRRGVIVRGPFPLFRRRGTKTGSRRTSLAALCGASPLFRPGRTVLTRPVVRGSALARLRARPPGPSTSCSASGSGSLGIFARFGVLELFLVHCRLEVRVLCHFLFVRNVPIV